MVVRRSPWAGSEKYKKDVSTRRVVEQYWKPSTVEDASIDLGSGSTIR
jgi:hypothetical protein